MIGASYFFTCLELMMANKLANTALVNANIMPLVYWVSNLNIKAMPEMINSPEMISNREIRVLFMSGSNMAVNKVMDERHTNVTGTVDNLMDAKNNIQCPPTKAPVKKSCRKVLRETLIMVLLILK
jgi:hypothetical protein